MATQIETLKVYLIGMEYPNSLNEPLPLSKFITLAGDWRTEDVQLSRRSICRAHRHIGLVLHYDSMTHIAVLLLGSSSPRRPHRYIPWEGTARLPFQTSEILTTEGPDFCYYPGYLNFSHAIRVVVIQPDAIASARNDPALGLACISEILDRAVNPPDVLHIQLHRSQLELLKLLHGSYWAGFRYTFEGTVVGSKDGAGDGEDEVGVHREHGSTSGDKCDKKLNEGGGALPTGGAFPTEEDARAESSRKLGRALAWEEYRNSQLTMVDGSDEDEDPGVDINTLPKCVIMPLTEQDLRRGFSTYESSVGFPWEELHVNKQLEI